MNYGFIIDNRKCIGCHACSTACKSENEVPLGVNRTWVKYVETGVYPNSTRHFQVSRCNHCENPPCVRICPVTAMYQRADGIVEFDPEVCIGCKACMQACPYDAIYIDPDSHTAAKCHYCAHRIDVGLEPACVVVCPEHAIISGDMDNPDTEISKLLAANKVTVRRPEQGTAPKLFYIHGNEVSLHPSATERTPETYMWADVIPLHPAPTNGAMALLEGTTNGHESGNGHNGHATVATAPAKPRRAQSGAALRPAQPQGEPWRGPIQMGQGRMAEQMVQVAYNAQHLIPWHWPVPAYLVTKAIGSGIFMVLALGWLLKIINFAPGMAVLSGFLSLLFIGITTALLVLDLERPERFLKIITRPQWNSWLTRGAFILIGFSLLLGIWWILETAAYVGIGSSDAAAAFRPIAIWLGLPLAVGTAVYTAFLFGQAEGRDLWQSSLLPFHLLVQALMVGSGIVLLLDVIMPVSDGLNGFAFAVLAIALVVDLFVTLLGEFGMPHASDAAAKAAHAISNGRYRNLYWWGSIGLGHVVPLILLWLGHPALTAQAGIYAIIGLFLFEYAFVMAPQEVPNS